MSSGLQYGPRQRIIAQSYVMGHVEPPPQLEGFDRWATADISSHVCNGIAIVIVVWFCWEKQ